eukprot:1046836_1
MSINPVNFGPVADSQSMKLELSADSEPVDADGLTDSDKSNVYVQGLPPHVDEDLLYAMFCGYGIVRKWTIKRQPSGESRSYGFVQFDNQNSAENAIASLTGVSINGRKLVVRIAIPKHIQTIQINLYVKNLPPTMTTERLRDLFKPFGTVTSHTIMKDENGVCTGVGFVRFLKEEQGRAAVSDLNGQRPGTDFTTEGICVEEAKEPARAQQQPQQRYGPVYASGGANRQLKIRAMFIFTIFRRCGAKPTYFAYLSSLVQLHLRKYYKISKQASRARSVLFAWAMQILLRGQFTESTRKSLRASL